MDSSDRYRFSCLLLSDEAGCKDNEIRGNSGEVIMLYLMKKNAFFFILNAVSISALLTLYWLLVRINLDGVLVIFQGLWMVLIVEGAIAANEKSEEKSKGYEFLRILPLTDRDIVRAKFILVLLTSVFVLACNSTLYLYMQGPAYLKELGPLYALVCANFCLVLGGVSYIIIFRFGYATFAKFVWIAMIVIMVTPILLLEFVFLKMDLDFKSIIEKINQWNWAISACFTIVGLTVYFFLMQTAIKAKKATRGL